MIATSRRRRRVFLPYNGSLLWDLGVAVRIRRRFKLGGVCQAGGSLLLDADIGLTIVATLVGGPASVVTRSSDVVLHQVHDSQIRLDRCRLCRLRDAGKFFERTRSCDVCVDLSPVQRHARPASSIAQTSLAPPLSRVIMAECGHVFMTS